MVTNGRKIFTFYKGRVALYALLKAFGIGPGHEVILPGYTCVVVPSAVRFAGADPVYADIDPLGFNITPATAAPRITGRTKAIIVQHTYGIPAEMGGFRELARRRGLLLIEDSCHAWGSHLADHLVGMLGDAAFFSSQWSKPFTTGLGGFCVIDPAQSGATERMEKIRDSFRWPSSLERFVLGLEYAVYRLLYGPRTYWGLMSLYRALYTAGVIPGSSTRRELSLERPLDYEKRMAAGEERKLGRLIETAEPVVAHRKKIAEVYRRLLPEPEKPAGADPVYLRFPVRVGNKRLLLEKAALRKIELGDWFVSPLHPVTTGVEKLGYRPGLCPASEIACSQTVNLPTHSGIGEDEALRIAEFVTREGRAC